MTDPALRKHDLHLVLLVDVSGSMLSDGKIQSLNTAVDEAIRHLQRALQDAPDVRVLIRVIGFGSAASLAVPEATALAGFTWVDLSAERGGFTEMGAAIELARQALARVEGTTPLAPALVLVSDGLPTDATPPTFDEAMQRLEAAPFPASASRVAIAIGRDADLATLARFVGPAGPAPLRADTPQQLAQLLREAVSQLTRAATRVT